MRPLLAAVCLLLAGCSGGKENPTTTIKVRFAITGAGLTPQWLPVQVAQALRYFEREGLEMSFESLQSSAKVMQALLGGSVDAGEIGYLQSIQMAAQGQKVPSFYCLSNTSISTVVISFDLAATFTNRYLEAAK